MGTYVRPNIYTNTNNQNLDFKRLAVVFHQNKSIGDNVNSFDEINNSELLKNIKFSNFYKTTDNFENTIKNINFLNSDDKVLNITSTENSINNNSNIPSSGEISIFNFINTIQYKFKRIDFTGNNLTDVNLYTSLNDYDIGVFQINIAVKMSGSAQNKPALTINIDDLKSNYPKIKYINLFLQDNITINGYNGVGSGSTLANGINGGDGQTGGNGGNALEIISTGQTADADKIKIFIKNANRIIKGYGANGGVGGARGRSSAPVVYNPDYRAEINSTEYLPFSEDATSATTSHYIVYKSAVSGAGNGEWRYMAVTNGYGFDIHITLKDSAGNPIKDDSWNFRQLPKIITSSTINWTNPSTQLPESRAVVDTHSAYRHDSDPNEETHFYDSSFDINWKMYYYKWEANYPNEGDSAKDFGNREAYLYQIKRERKYTAVGNPITYAEQAYAAGTNGNNAILYGQSGYNDSIYDGEPDNFVARANTGGANFTGTSRSNTEGTSGTGGIHGRHGSAIVSSTNTLLKKDNESSYS